ncbi:MAG: M14 family metallocarboxypeptidase [Clostridia bacterium]|nr:M14 family metallocarboxypeptidase [Clostridia bacterium]
MNERIIGYTQPLDHKKILELATIFTERYPFLGFSYLGESLLGRGIPLFTVGSGKKNLLYVGAHHGMEWITSVILLRFLNEFCELYRNDKSIYRTSLYRFCEQYTVNVIPMLNPDGVEYQIHGITEENPLFERLIKMNCGEDFSGWQANARGVDLNHNYDAEFAEYKRESGITEGAPTRYAGEFPESEPEVAQLCNWIRFHEDLRLILTLHTQGEEIYFDSRGKCPPASTAIARRISALSGYRLSHATGLASYGGLTDWCIEKLGLPAFTIECGRGKNPLPIANYFPIYATLREVLFTIGKMV